MSTEKQDFRAFDPTSFLFILKRDRSKQQRLWGVGVGRWFGINFLIFKGFIACHDFKLVVILRLWMISKYVNEGI